MHVANEWSASARVPTLYTLRPLFVLRSVLCYWRQHAIEFNVWGARTQQICLYNLLLAKEEAPRPARVQLVPFTRGVHCKFFLSVRIRARMPSINVMSEQLAVSKVFGAGFRLRLPSPRPSPHAQLVLD